MFPDDNPWYPVRDGDPRAYALFKEHYSFHEYKDNRRKVGRNRFLICGPGEKLVLITQDCKALFVWRKFKSDDGQEGVNCAVFRNIGAGLSSELILKAEELARGKWGGTRLYTYVKASAVASSNPGYCFIKAGWDKLPNQTKVNKLIIMEKYL